MDQDNVSRRDLIRKAGLGLAATSVVLAGCAPKEVQVEVTKEVPQEIPAGPWSYAKLETEPLRKAGHARYYDAGCAYGAFAAIIEALREKVGFPFTQVPMNMMAFGGGGVAGWGTTCGALLGAAAAINIVTPNDVAKTLINELMTWYTQTPFPSETSNQYAVNHEFLVTEYKSDAELPQSVSGSPLCHVSVSNWCQASGIATGAKERAERCGRLTGDVVAKAVEILNANLDGTFAASFKLSDETQTCMSCHTSGENFAAGNNTAGKMECTDCHEPHN